MVRVDGKGPEHIDTQLDDIGNKIEAEEARWQAMGIDPSRLALNGFIINVRSLALFDVLRELLQVDEKEMELLFKKRLLEEMEAARPLAEQAVKNIQQAHRESIVASNADLSILKKHLPPKQ